MRIPCQFRKPETRVLGKQRANDGASLASAITGKARHNLRWLIHGDKDNRRLVDCGIHVIAEEKVPGRKIQTPLAAADKEAHWDEPTYLPRTAFTHSSSPGS